LLFHRLILFTLYCLSIYSVVKRCYIPHLTSPVDTSKGFNEEEVKSARGRHAPGSCSCRGSTTLLCGTPSQPLLPPVERLKSGAVRKSVSSFLEQRARDASVGYPRQGCRKWEWTDGAEILLFRHLHPANRIARALVIGTVICRSLVWMYTPLMRCTF
jgi:hypothetical protein